MYLTKFKSIYYINVPRKVRGFISSRVVRYKRKTILDRFKETNSIFVHIPKSAGISLINSLYGGSYKLIGHLYLMEIYSALSFDESSEINVIVFSRSPYSRLFSAYNFLKQGGMNEVDKYFSDKILSKYKDFDDFVMNGLESDIVQRYMHFEPQINYIKGFERKSNIRLHVNKYENINSDYKKLCDDLGYGLDLLSLNVTKKSDITGVMKLEVKNKIEQVYKEDFDFFGYEREH
ncbi:sulfotransferase family 2 domain-containing protein [Vibrio cyclitrophicus]